MSIKYLEDLAFNANQQEFAQWVSYVCALESSGKISEEKAYFEVKILWEELMASHEGLSARQAYSLEIN